MGLPIQQAVKGENGKGELIDYRNKETLAIWNYFPRMGWGIVVKIDVAEALAEVRILKWRYLIVGTITFFVLVIIAFFVSKTIFSPLLQD